MALQVFRHKISFIEFHFYVFERKKNHMLPELLCKSGYLKPTERGMMYFEIKTTNAPAKEGRT
jgi:hypothetical protein